MVNVKLGDKTYEGVTAVKTDTTDGGTAEFAPYDETFAAGKAEGIEEGYANGKADGYAAGKTDGIAEGIQTEYDRFWDSFQDYGKPHRYEFAFAGDSNWTEENFKPKYDLICGNGYSATAMFRQSSLKDISALLEKQNKVLDTSRVYSFYEMYYGCKSDRVPGMNATGSTDPNCMTHAFNGFLGTTIDKIITAEHILLTSCFMNVNALANITFEGVIGQNIDMHWSPLTADSLISVISHLSNDATEKTVSFMLSAVNTAFETAEGAADGSTSQEWLDLVATKPNWTISLV